MPAACLARTCAISPQQPSHRTWIALESEYVARVLQPPQPTRRLPGFTARRTIRHGTAAPQSQGHQSRNETTNTLPQPPLQRRALKAAQRGFISDNKKPARGGFFVHSPCLRNQTVPTTREGRANYLAADSAACLAASAAWPAASAAAGAAASAAGAAASAAGAAASAAGASAAGAAGASAAGAGASTAGAAGAAGASSFLPQAARAAAAITVARTRDFFMTIFLLRMSYSVCRTCQSTMDAVNQVLRTCPPRARMHTHVLIKTHEANSRFTGLTLISKINCIRYVNQRHVPYSASSWRNTNGRIPPWR